MRRLGLVMALAVVVGLVVVVFRGRCDEREGLLEFPYRLEIAPGNYLFVDGHELHGEVLCTWEEGDSVRIEGIPVLPARGVKEVPTEEELRERYGEDGFVVDRVDGGMTWAEAVRERKLRNSYRWNPYVVERVEAGKTWEEGVREYYRKREETTDKLNRAFWRARESGLSKEMAAQAALDSLDWTVMDPTFEPKAYPTGMPLRFVGKEEVSISFTYKPPWEMPTLEELQRVTPKKASYIIRSIASCTSQERTACMQLVSRSAHISLYGASVSKALNQLAESSIASIAKGPIPEREMKRILRAREVGRDEVAE